MDTLVPGTIVGMRYRIAARLGTGGMGSVYRAEHLGLRKEVALKVLEPGLGGDLEARARFEKRFEREARTSALLDHPNCVRVFDYGMTLDGRRFLAMELLPGPSLCDVIQRVRMLPVSRAVRITREVLAALAYAHEQSVLHRDVKPENVMFAEVRPLGRAVLIDFGLARLFGDPALTGSGTCVGSPSYLAPERLLARPYDARADLYSVGVMLYEMLAGVRPFLGADSRQIARAQIREIPRPLRAIRLDVPRSLEAIVVRTMAKDPGRRFLSATEMLAALDEVRDIERHRAERAVGVMSQQRTGELEARAAPVAPAAEPPESPTVLALPRTLKEPSRLRRAWAWLRYGAWRRRDLAREPSLG